MEDPTEVFFKALCNRCRFAILTSLLGRPLNVGDISKSIGLEQSHLSHHLQELLKSRMIEVEARGHFHRYRLNKDMKRVVRAMLTYVAKYAAYSKSAPKPVGNKC